MAAEGAVYDDLLPKGKQLTTKNPGKHSKGMKLIERLNPSPSLSLSLFLSFSFPPSPVTKRYGFIKNRKMVLALGQE